MTVCDGDGGVVYTTLWHGTLDGGMAVDESGGENGNEYGGEDGGEDEDDSRLDMGTGTILVGLWAKAPPPGFEQCARQKSWACSP